MERGQGVRDVRGRRTVKTLISENDFVAVVYRFFTRRAETLVNLAAFRPGPWAADGGPARMGYALSDYQNINTL